MNLGPFLTIALTMLVAGFSPASQATVQSVHPRAQVHLRWARSMSADLRRQSLDGYVFDAEGNKLNDYSAEKFLQWKSDGNPFTENRSLCAQHVTSVYKRAYGWSDAQLLARFGSTSPSAEKFYWDIVNGIGFTRVANCADFSPGDQIAISYADDPNSGYPSTSGHTAFINAVGPRISHQFSNGTSVEFRDVQVIESSSSVRSLDSRTFQAGELGPGSPYTEWKGQGTGWMRIYVDSADRYLGYTWSMTADKTDPLGTPASWSYYSASFKPESLRHFCVGRVDTP